MMTWVQGGPASRAAFGYHFPQPDLETATCAFSDRAGFAHGPFNKSSTFYLEGVATSLTAA